MGWGEDTFLFYVFGFDFGVMDEFLGFQSSISCLFSYPNTGGEAIDTHHNNPIPPAATTSPNSLPASNGILHKQLNSTNQRGNKSKLKQTNNRQTQNTYFASVPFFFASSMTEAIAKR